MLVFYNLQSMTTSVNIVSIINLFFAIALIITGSVAASFSLSKHCEEHGCSYHYKNANNMVKLAALGGTLPGIVPFVCGIFGVVTAMEKVNLVKWMVGVLLAFTIIGCILCLIGTILTLYGAYVFTRACNYEWDRACDIREGLWAVAVLNVILAIFQFIFAIILSCALYAKHTIWEQADGGAAPGGLKTKAYLQLEDGCQKLQSFNDAK